MGKKLFLHLENLKLLHPHSAKIVKLNFSKYIITWPRNVKKNTFLDL